MFLRNAWYMAGWSTDFTADKPVAVKMLKEPIVVYRTADGGIAALEDRCCHRLAPLSVGVVEGDDIRCMYHGIKFAPDGRCTEIPGQDRISPAVRVKSYPVQERHACVWVWMGDAKNADEALIPKIHGSDDPFWALGCSTLDIAANAELICDNLLDLSHAPFVHAGTFAGADPESIKLMLAGEAKRELVELSHGVRAERWQLGRTSHIYLGDVATDEHVVSDFVTPGVFTLTITTYTPGVLERAKENGGQLEEPFFMRTTNQMITPIDERSSKFFFNFGPWAKSAELKEHAFSIAAKAFLEDKAIIEAQQEMIDQSPDSKMIMLAMDQPVVHYNKIRDRIRVEYAEL